ncbi:MAG: hypothetical protein RDU20_18070 [Desulfomonilaceae bacterium]|nr:hypothetical protein [Desulfomonilaceae bacterium]
MNQGATINHDSVSTVRIKTYVLLVLGFVHVVVTLFFIVPGYLLIDEVIYHWASKGFVQIGGFEIWNGYEEFPSPELYHKFTAPFKGRSVSQYPYLFTVLTYPFYLLMGFYGLFLCNAVSFAGVVVLCYATARKIFNDLDLALNACLILVLCTFAWEYSQAAWPHTTSMLFITAAFYLFVCSYLSTDRLTSLYLALGAGLIGGFATSIRMEGVFLYPVLILPFLFQRPWRPREALAVIAGMLPGLTIFAMVNEAKFGMFSPFSYGGPTNMSPYFGAALVGVVAVMWAITRSRFTDFVNRRRKSLYLTAGIVLMALVVIPPTRSLIVEVATYSYVSVVDIRSLDPDLVRPAMSRSSGDGVVYIGAQKKALLQSMPYLVILLIPLLRIARRHEDGPALTILFLMPVITVGYYSHAFHASGAYEGGLCLNYRYFLPLFPFFSILSAYAIREIRARWGAPPSFPTSAIVSFVTVLAYFFFVHKWLGYVDYLELPLLLFPLFVAAFLLALIAVGELVSGGEIRLMKGVVWTALVVALTWSSLTALVYDYPVHRNQRVVNYTIGESLRRVIPPNSIFFTAPVVDPFMRLIENDRVRIAFPYRDRFKDFSKLTEFHLKAGRRVYGAFYDDMWKNLMSGPLAGYSVQRRFRPISAFPHFWVGEIQPLVETGPAPAD